MPLPVRDLDPGPIHGSWDELESAPERHLDRLSHFCTAHSCAQNTDTHKHTNSQANRHTDHATCDIGSNRPHIYTACGRCSRIITIPIIK